MMIKIVALNDGDQDEDVEQEVVVATREAQEAIAESEYIRAIKFRTDKKDEVTLHVLNELLKTDVLNEVKTDDKLWFIKYNCHKNIAIILEERCEYEKALQNYISAILIDNTDVYTLHKFGQLALRLNAIELAEYAFENCLGKNSSHWRAAGGMLNSLCRNSNVVGAYSSALQICRRNPADKMAVQMIAEIDKWFQRSLLFKVFGTSNLNISQCGNKFMFEILFKSNRVDVKNERGCEHKDLQEKLKNIFPGVLTWRSIGQFIVDSHALQKEMGHDVFLDFNFKDIFKTQSMVDDSDKHIQTTFSTVQSNVDETQCSNSISVDVEQNPTKTISSENGEPQPMDYNNEDSDSNAKSDGCESTKSKPRRRCSDLHFLEQWGWHKNRRYSSRKKAEKEEIDDSLNCYLRRIFSKYMHASVEGKWPFSEGEDDGHNDNLNSQCASCQKKHTEETFQQETESKFDSFITELQATKIDLMVLIFKWLKYVAQFWSIPMPDELKQIYLEIFQLYICHYDLSSWNQLPPCTYEHSFRICSLYLELAIDKRQIHTEDIWQKIFHHLNFNTGVYAMLASNKTDFFELRLVYMEYLLFTEKSQYKDCLMCLDRMASILREQNESFILHLPNMGNACINMNYIETIQMKYKSQIDVGSIPAMYEKELWPQITSIITSNIETGKDNYENENWLMDFCTLLQILLQSFWKMGSYESCLVWSEKCLHYAVSHYLEEVKSTHRQKLLANVINFITSYIEAVILNDGYVIVEQLNGDAFSRMVQNLIRILVYLFDGTFEKNSTHGIELDFKRPWVILHQLVLREEADYRIVLDSTNDQIEDLNETVPNSFLILFTAHEQLGRRQWCSNDNGEFLQYILDAVVLNFKAPIYDVCRDVIYENIEQVTYCLFKYPQKKARSKHLEDHEALPVKLVWPTAIQIFNLYQPEHLPEFNSYKLESISSDMEQMLLKIISLMPKELDPSETTHNVISYIEGQSTLDAVQTLECNIPYKIINIYYLLADFYFKTRDFMKAIKYYTLDLAVNPTRFDSWAGMALSKASLIETKLNGLEPISQESLWEECEQVLRCFESCITLNKYQTLLWIEYGSFCYTIHSYFTRYLKYNAELPAELSTAIQLRKDRLLNIAHNCFSLTNSLQNSTTNISEDAGDANDEKWLCQYMLGKISEKRKEQPSFYLNHYLMAANYLYESNATYPIKINHSNPTALSVEALEVFYRINAAIIKYITFSKNISRSDGDLFNKVLVSLSNSPFAFNKAKIDGNSLTILKRRMDLKMASNANSTQSDANCGAENKNVATKPPYNNEEAKAVENISSHPPQSQSPSTSSSSSSAISTESSGGDSESDSEVLPSDGQAVQTTNSSSYTLDELKTIYRMVIQNIEECATRFPEHYKSFYRLIYHFMNSPPEYRDLENCQQLLIGQYKTSLGNIVNGLFYERKNNNLFNGIWRIPSSEIDRPGSFSSHLVKCVEIFILFLSKTNNHKILIDIALNLYKTPDVDKRYIADGARKKLYQECITYTVNILRGVLQTNMTMRNDSEILNLLIDIYKIHKKCIKYMNQKEPTFTKLLEDVYKFYIADKVEQIPENCNILDLAIKLCVQEISQRKAAEKSTNIERPTSYLSEYFTAETTQAMIARTFNIPGINLNMKQRADLSKIVLPNMPQNDTNNPHSLVSSPQYMPLIRPASVDNQTSQNEVTESIQHFNRYDTTIMERGICANLLQTMNETDAALRYSMLETEILKSSLLTTSYDIKQQPKGKVPIKSRRASFKPYQRDMAFVNQNSCTINLESPTNLASPLSLIGYSDTSNAEQMSKVTMTKVNTSMDKAPGAPMLFNVKAESASTSTTIYDADTVSTAQLRTDIPSSSHPNKQIPVKTLQQKLAERQKSNQMNEQNLLSASSAGSQIDNDIIILD